MAIHKLTDLKIRAKLREIQELSFSPSRPCKTPATRMNAGDLG